MGTAYWSGLTGQEQAWVTEATRVSAQAQKKFWADNVKSSMEKLEAAGVEIYRRTKSLFAESSSAVLKRFAEDPVMKQLVEDIQGQ